jgi:hypothetical protein
MSTDLPTADAASLPPPGLCAVVADMVAELRRSLLGRYHPERHYMRGPGPAWRANRHVPTSRPAIAPINCARTKPGT